MQSKSLSVFVAVLMALVVVWPYSHATAAEAPKAPAKAEKMKLNGDRFIELTTTKALHLVLPKDVKDVLIADPAVADIVIKSPRSAYLIGFKTGDTNAFFMDHAGNRVLTLDIRVEKDLTALRRAIKTLVPNNDVIVRSANGDIVLSGDVPSAAIATNIKDIARRFVDPGKDIVNLMKVTGAEQVLIKVRVTEMRRSVTKQLGLSMKGINGDVDLVSGASDFATGLFSDRFASAVITGSVLGFDNLEMLIEALEEDGYVKTLAEPNLTALSGESADFLAGGEFPVPVSRDDQNRITIEFKPFGVRLAFTPIVLDSKRINLKISTEVSALSNEGAFDDGSLRIQSLTVRRAQTTVEIPSGGSLILGGLLRNDDTNTIRGLPVLADLPVLGTLFRSTDFQRDETELVVIAIPYVVKPVRPTDLMTPVDGFRVGNDFSQFLMGKLYERYRVKEPAPAALRNDLGFIID